MTEFFGILLKAFIVILAILLLVAVFQLLRRWLADEKTSSWVYTSGLLILMGAWFAYSYKWEEGFSALGVFLAFLQAFFFSMVSCGLIGGIAEGVKFVVKFVKKPKEMKDKCSRSLYESPELWAWIALSLLLLPVLLYLSFHGKDVPTERLMGTVCLVIICALGGAWLLFGTLMIVGFITRYIIKFIIEDAGRLIKSPKQWSKKWLYRIVYAIIMIPVLILYALMALAFSSIIGEP